MPKKVERCVDALKKKGTPEDQAWAICKAQYDSEEEYPSKKEKNNPG